MDLFKLNPELLGILMFLAPGYLGFRLYQIDQPWGTLNAIDVIYGSLLFSTVAYGSYLLLVHAGWADIPSRRIACLVVFSLLFGFIWRRFGHRYFHKLAHWLKVTNEDNSFTAWSLIFNNPNVYLSQILVELKDGQQLWCNNTLPFINDKLRASGVHPYYSDAVGNLYIISTHRRLKATDEWEELPDVSWPAPWGVNVSFIPASQIARIDVRATESG